MAAGSAQKRIFQAVTILFVLLMIFFTVQFMSRTTRPGKKGQLRERIQQRIESDTTRKE